MRSNQCLSQIVRGDLGRVFYPTSRNCVHIRSKQLRRIVPRYSRWRRRTLSCYPQAAKRRHSERRKAAKRTASEPTRSCRAQNNSFAACRRHLVLFSDTGRFVLAWPRPARASAILQESEWASCYLRRPRPAKADGSKGTALPVRCDLALFSVLVRTAVPPSLSTAFTKL